MLDLGFKRRKKSCQAELLRWTGAVGCREATGNCGRDSKNGDRRRSLRKKLLHRKSHSNLQTNVKQVGGKNKEHAKEGKEMLMN